MQPAGIETHKQQVEQHLRTRKVRPHLVEIPESLPGEQWRHLAGFKKVLVSSEGRVWSLESGRVLKGQPDRKGYPRFSLVSTDGSRRLVTVSRLVLRAFVGEPAPGYHAAHIDGNPSNNVLANLRFCSPVENAADKRLHGTDRVPWVKLTEGDIREIRARFSAGGITLRALGDRYGVSESAVSLIVRRLRWAYVD
jgi:hypothetical protein